jgi:hypothetical protein
MSKYHRRTEAGSLFQRKVQENGCIDGPTKTRIPSKPPKGLRPTRHLSCRNDTIALLRFADWDQPILLRPRAWSSFVS